MTDVHPVYLPAEDLPSGTVDDLATKTNLNQDILLQELKVRYANNVIYTFVSDILIAVNPFKQLPIYGQENMAKYNNALKGALPPHVYAIADACFYNLEKMRKNQCAVISGESGAGKTESAKYLVKQIIELCSHGKASSDSLEDKIIKVSPVLEAFGNAQTCMNDNSSRFGKYSRLLFNSDYEVMGVQISEYLLEKSRVIEQKEGERNFHVFYYIFASPEAQSTLLLTEPSAYHSLGGALWPDNAKMYKELIDALNAVGFTAEEQTAIHALLAAVVHLSNIQFEGTEAASVKSTSRTALKSAATLMKVGVEFLEKALTVLHTVTRGEHIDRTYTPEQAYDCRDAMSKAIYQRLFSWIVSRVNELLAPGLHLSKTERPGVAAVKSIPAYEIGVLDIFGFENFKDNSFEQICINLAHEQLQNFFNKHTFQLELEEYAKEGIDGKTISFTDNGPLLTMFLDRPVGILSLLDEECSFPKATDASFVGKLEGSFRDHRFYKTVKVSRGYPSFSIMHFPGEVEYNATNFLEKNRDNLAVDLVEVLQSSDVNILSDMFFGEITSTGQIALRKRELKAKMHRGKEQESNEVVNKANRKAPSLSAQFKNSLTELVDKMFECYPHFIRCIKPNQAQRPDHFLDDFVKVQLGYTGVLEATRIRQEGYSWRPEFAEFVRRFKIIAFPVTMLSRVQENVTNAKRILERAKLKDYQVGKTKLFLKYYHAEEMEGKLKEFYNQVIKVQSVGRAYNARKIYKRRLARQRMNAAERAAAEAKEAEERKAQEARLAELARLEKERAQAELRKQEEERLAMEAAAAQAEAEARKAEAELRKIAEESKAEESAEAARRAQELADRAREEQEKALQEAIEAREAELRALQEAEQLKKEKEQAEEEARKMRTERQNSIKRREEESVKQKEEAEAKEKLAAELTARLQKAEEEAEKAKQRAAAIEAQRQEEEKIKKEDFESSNFESPSFDLTKFVKKQCGHTSAADVQVEAKFVRGKVSKTGIVNKAWKNRYFVLSVEDEVLRYYESDKTKKEKGSITAAEIIRVFAPPMSAQNKTPGAFLIETLDRTYFCKTGSDEATAIWVAALSVFGIHKSKRK